MQWVYIVYTSTGPAMNVRVIRFTEASRGSNIGDLAKSPTHDTRLVGVIVLLIYRIAPRMSFVG